VFLTLQEGFRAATTGEDSVKPYPFCTFKPIACMQFYTNIREDEYKHPV